MLYNPFSCYYWSLPYNEHSSCLSSVYATVKWITVTERELARPMVMVVDQCVKVGAWAHGVQVDNGLNSLRPLAKATK